MSTLTNHRSKWLAATAPLSGGATELDWSPRDPIPMLVTWGGPTDEYYGFRLNLHAVYHMMAETMPAHTDHSVRTSPRP